MNPLPAEGILRYHEETKHHPERYARSLGYMDWENQPNPFRRYEGAPVVDLPLLARDPPGGASALYEPGRPGAPFVLANVAAFLELSMGLSAWKAVSGSRWALRMNPSSGNLHPTETHLVLPRMPGCDAGVYHYAPLLHALERRAELSEDLVRKALSHLGCEGFLAGLTSIFWRESWKYGERAFRYCNHDVGHALAGMRVAANLLGWRLTCLSGLSDDAVEAVLGLRQTRYPRLDEEHPDLLCIVHTDRGKSILRALPQEWVAAFEKIRFVGRPNPLSREHVDWEIIGRAAEFSRKPDTASEPAAFGRAEMIRADDPALSAAAIIRRRRSATDFDRRRGIPRAHFLAMLDKTRPRDGIAPFDAGLGEPALHLLIFVHQVETLQPGLYFFCRNERDLPEVQSLSRPGFAWQPAEPGFPLFLLEPGNLRQTAAMVSCHQEIAGASAFSLGMLARFGEIVRREPHRYRHLFWESGMIGQVLYLEAEAHGVRGTGIGCFFDDAVHEILGLADDRYQSLYHFTVGHPLEDSRLTTLPPYSHLRDR
ncbi:MAG: SagB/ThcOx family dehydrogenase [Desulfobacterales bacterium]